MVEGKERNSFKELQEQEVEKYEKNIDRVKKSMDSNLETMSFITNVIDIYFSKVVSYVVNLGGGSQKEEEKD